MGNYFSFKNNEIKTFAKKKPQKTIEQITSDTNMIDSLIVILNKIKQQTKHVQTFLAQN